METDNNYYEQLEPRVGRQFRSRPLLRQAMIAPATEADNYEGHRKFAQIGEWLLQFILGHRYLQMDSTRGYYLADINDLVGNIAGRDHRASVATSMGLVLFIKCSPRQKEGPSKGTLSSTISALVYATWSDSGGDWSETVKVMRHMGIYPIHSPKLETRPDSGERSTSSSNMNDGDLAFVAREQEHEGPSMATLLMEYIVPSALDLTPAGEKENVVNADDTEVLDRDGLTASRSPMALQDSSTILMGKPGSGSAPSPGSYMWITPANSDTEDLRQASEDLPNFGPSDTDDISQFTQGLGFLTTGTGHLQDYGEREDALETSISSTVSTDHQGALTCGESRLTESSRADRTTTANDEEHLVAHDTPSRNMESSPEYHRETVTSTKARRAATEEQNTRRRKRPSQCGAAGSPCRLYIAHERAKVLDKNLCCREDYFTTRRGQTRVTELDLEDYVDTLEVMNFTLGSCETFVVLGDIVRAYLKSFHARSADIDQNLCLPKRFQAIHASGGKAAYHILVRNLHILYFTRESASKFPVKSGGFIELSQDRLQPQSKRQRGNPLHLAEAAITRKAMKEIHPNLDEDSKAYRKLYIEVKVLRKYGQRLDQLVEAFGLGILGLMPLISSISTANQAFEATHTALFSSTDKVFSNLVMLTNECQGDVLRKLAGAAQPLLEGILHQETDGLMRAGISNAAREDIMQYPKGAPELVKLLSRTSGPEDAKVQSQGAGSEK